MLPNPIATVPRQESLTLAHLEVLIANQQRSVRWHVSLAVSLTLFGLAVLGVSLLWGAGWAEEPANAILGVAGGFISTGSAFPLREILSCRERLDIYRGLQRTFTSANPDEIERIRNLVWQVVAKTAGS